MLLAASLITTNLVFASDYKNNVVDVKVNKESNSAVKVTIYTDKPYTEPVVVNKKANNKYVILMPETKSSLKSTPSVSNASGTVSNVSVNTQAVSGGKGYTKIIITSEKAITVVPKTQTVSSGTQTKTPVVKQAQPTKPTSVSKPVTDKNAAALKAKQEQERKLKAQQEAKTKQLTAQKTQQEKAKRLAAQKAQQEKAKRLAAQKAQQEAAAKRAAEQRAKEQAQKNVAQQPQSLKPTVPKTTTRQPIEILEQEIKTDKNANFSQNSNDPILNQEIQENIEKNKNKAKSKKKRAAVQYANTGNQSVIENIKVVIRDYQNISLWKLLLLASAITFPLVVIMVILGMDKKINKRIDKYFKREEEPVYDNYEEDVEEIVEEDDAPAQQFKSFEDMLNQVEEPLPSFHEEQLHRAQYEQFQQSVNQPLNETYVDEEVVADEPVSVEPELVSEEEFNNDFETEDFKHDFVNEQETTVDEVIENAEDEKALPSVEMSDKPYTPDGYLSDFAGVSDKEFFDELVLQSMAENNINGLPEESPADEIFDFMTSNENNTVETVKQETTEQPVESTYQKPEVEVETSVDNAVMNEVFEQTQETVSVESASSTESNTIEPVESSTDDDLTMLTEVKLSENTGLYLVNYDNFSSLVGHIDDNYYVIKKFDGIVNGNIVLKQAEKLKNSTRYLVRVGKNKMVVEVSENSMSRLLDL